MKNPFAKKNKKYSSLLRPAVELAREGKGKEGRDAMLKAETFYFNRIQTAITPFPTDDTALVVVMLRHIANKLEQSTPETKCNVEHVQKSFVPMDVKINFKNKEVK
jgi:hypothetical protein